MGHFQESVLSGKPILLFADLASSPQSILPVRPARDGSSGSRHASSFRAHCPECGIRTRQAARSHFLHGVGDCTRDIAHLVLNDCITIQGLSGCLRQERQSYSNQLPIRSGFRFERFESAATPPRPSEWIAAACLHFVHYFYCGANTAQEALSFSKAAAPKKLPVCPMNRQTG